MRTPPWPLALRTFPIIFAAPSGAGKTTIAHQLRSVRDDVEFSVSATTREPRPGETDGTDYHFCSRPGFEQMMETGELLEWAEVHGQMYGTPRSNLEQARSRHHFLVLDIDVQGSRQVKRLVPEAVSIFVLPPSGQELARRLVDRGSEDQERQRRRLRAAREELKAATEFDFVIVNRDLDRAVEVVDAIITSESRRLSRLDGLEEYVAELISEVDRIVEL